MNLRATLRAFSVAIALSAMAVPLAALEQKPFDAAAVKAAQEAGKPVIIHVTAPWCPTCTAQHAAIDALAGKPEFDHVTLFKIDFDTQEDAWTGFGARTQSTLIAFSGKQETGRLVGETKAAPIESLFASALAK